MEEGVGVVEEAVVGVVVGVGGWVRGESGKGREVAEAAGDGGEALLEGLEVLDAAEAFAEGGEGDGDFAAGGFGEGGGLLGVGVLGVALGGEGGGRGCGVEGCEAGFGF